MPQHDIAERLNQALVQTPPADARAARAFATGRDVF